MVGWCHPYTPRAYTGLHRYNTRSMPARTAVMASICACEVAAVVASGCTKAMAVSIAPSKPRSSSALIKSEMRGYTCVPASPDPIANPPPLTALMRIWLISPENAIRKCNQKMQSHIQRGTMIYLLVTKLFIKRFFGTEFLHKKKLKTKIIGYQKTS